MAESRVIRDFDATALHTSYARAEPFPFTCIDDFLEPEFARQVAAAYPDFDQASDKGHRFETVNEHLKVQVTDRAAFPEPVRILSEALHAEPFLAKLRVLTGIHNLTTDDRLLGGGMHLTASSGRLDIHTDFNYLPDVRLFRRINLLLYLNAEWPDFWGGNLELWDREMRVCVHSFAPILGRCVIFEMSNHSLHGTTEVTCRKNATRNSFALYYYSPDPPVGFQDDFQGTVFRARPTELLKGRVFMPLERIWHKLRHEAGKRRARR